MPKNKTLVIGASDNPQRYSNIAIRMLQSIEEPIVAIGRREGEAHGVNIRSGKPSLTDVDTVTLYVSSKYQDEYIDYIIDNIQPDRIIFNPGTENFEFAQKASQNGIKVLNACTLVMIRTGQY